MISLPSFRSSILKSLDPTAVAYGNTVGLASAEMLALSNHLYDITAAGIIPVQLTLGRSEWKARNGSSWRAVIGNNATITGTVTDATEGQQFNGTSGNYARFTNPLQNAALANIGMFVVGRGATGTTSQYMLSGYTGASARGPQLVLNASPVQGSTANLLYLDVHGSATTGLLTGVNSQRPVNSGAMMAFGGSFSANANPHNMAGANVVQSSNDTMATVFNNGSTWAIGGRPDLPTPINGAISYALLSSTAMTPDRYAALYSSAVKHGIIETEVTSVIAGFGDSLMEGTIGASNTILHNLTFTATGGSWRNACSAQNSGKGGEGITYAENTQKDAVARWARADGFANRWVVHFGAHNDAGYQSSDEATRNALMERYIAIYSYLQSLGAKIAVISPLDGSGGTAGQYAASSAYRTRLATRCAEEGFAYVNLYTDTGFAAATRNASYFVDTIHLSAAGQIRATELFVATISSPSYEP